MEDILINEGQRIEERYIITTFLLPEDKWTKEAAEKWIQRRYRNYEYLGKIAGYYQFRVLPESQIKEYEKKSAEIRGGKPGYRVFTFPSEKPIRALMLVIAPPIAEIENETSDISSLGENLEVNAGDIIENPVRKVTPEIAEEVKRLWKEGYKVIQIRGIIRDKFGVSISAPTVRNIVKDIPRGEQISNLENLIGGGTMPLEALPSELMSQAMRMFKEGKFKSKSEALKWAHAQKKSASPGEFQRVASEVLINKARKKKSLKGGTTMARKTKISEKGLERTLSRLTKAVEALSNPAKKRKRKKEKLAKGTLAAQLSEALRKVWETDPVLRAIRERLKAEVPPIVRATWEEVPEMRSSIRSRIREAWATPEGEAVRSALSREVKKARSELGVETSITELDEPEPEFDFIETAAIDVLFEDIGLPELRPFEKGMGLSPALKAAWETPAGKELKEAIRKAWLTPAGEAMREELSKAIKEVRAKAWGKSVSSLSEIAEAIEQLGKFKTGMAPYLRAAWSIPEASEFKRILRKAIWSAWGSDAGIKFKSLLKERLGKLWYGPALPITELAAIEQFPGDLVKWFGFDLLIPGAVSTIAEDIIHPLVKQLVSLPFGKKEDIEKTYWKKALVNLLAGGIHYGAFNWAINQFFRRSEFMQKARYMYSAYIIRDVVKALLPAGILSFGKKPTTTAPTGEVESVEYGVLPIEDLRVSETGELEVPVEVYEKMKANSIAMTPTEQGEEEEYEYIEEVFGPVVTEEELEPEVEIEEQPETELTTTIEEEEEEEGLAESES
jgi:hypothetical protein